MITDDKWAALASKLEWHDVKELQDFEAGMLLKLLDGTYELVGDCNECGGHCSCSGFYDVDRPVQWAWLIQPAADEEIEVPIKEGHVFINTKQLLKLRDKWVKAVADELRANKAEQDVHKQNGGVPNVLTSMHHSNLAHGFRECIKDLEAVIEEAS